MVQRIQEVALVFHSAPNGLGKDVTTSRRDFIRERVDELVCKYQRHCDEVMTQHEEI